MTEAVSPLHWSPEHVWKLLDQTLLHEKLSEIAEEMQLAISKDKGAALAKERKLGNSAAYCPERARLEGLHEEEWAEKQVQACLQVWEIQGYPLCPGLYRAIYSHLLVVCFSARKGSFTSELALEDHRTGRPGRSQGTLSEFARETQRRSSRWNRKLDILARECEHACKRQMAADEVALRAGRDALRGQKEDDAVRYPREFTGEARNRVEAARLKAARDFEDRRNQAPSSHWGPTAEDEKNLRGYILAVFLAFMREACKIGWQGVWALDKIRRECQEFLRLATIEAYYEKGHDKTGRKLREMTSHLNGGILPEVQMEFGMCWTICG
jgi:hypothetical protein